MRQAILEEQKINEKPDYQCAYVPCECIAKVGGYCSPQCEAAEFQDGIVYVCRCGHDKCRQEFVPPEFSKVIV